MKQDGSIALFQYWNRLRGGRPAPKRTEVEPADIKAHLADTFILEKDTRGNPVFRLAGTRLCAVFGRELKGFAFTSLWMEKDRALIARLTQSAFESRSVVVVTFDGVSTNARSVEFEMLVLPLDGGRDSPRALGSLAAIDKPYWLGIDPVVEARVLSIRVVDPEREPLFLTNRPAVPMAPSIAPDRGALSGTIRGAAAGRKIRHLVVYDGGRDED